MQYLKMMEIRLEKSTVYRYLNVLLERGMIRKYFVGKESTAWYRYVKEILKDNLVYHLGCPFMEKFKMLNMKH